MSEGLFFNTELRKCLDAAGFSDCGENDEWSYWYLRLHRAHDATVDRLADCHRTEIAKLCEQIEHLQPTDCEGNVLDIADTVHMLRSEYDGDHEWDDVVVELVLTKWSGDRWIVRGSRGEAWACDCTKTGYDEDAYENSDDAEPIEKPTLFEVENAKLRELLQRALTSHDKMCTQRGNCFGCQFFGPKFSDGPCPIFKVFQASRELGVEVDG